MIGTIVLASILAAVAIGVGWLLSYNRFVRQRHLIEEAWRQVDVELRRRHDLVPNLVETVRAYAAHERDVLLQVTEARQAAASPGSDIATQSRQEQALGNALGRLFAVSEGYPVLKADAHFVELQRQLAETEDRIAAARRFHNNNVRAYNTRLEMVPSSMVASLANLTPAAYFELDDPAERELPTLRLGDLDLPGSSGPPELSVKPLRPRQVPPGYQPPR